MTCQNGKVLERVSFGKLRVLPVMDLLHLLPLLSRPAPYIRNITRCQIFTNVMLWVYFMNEAVYSKGAILNHKISTFSEICLTEFVSRKCLQGASLFVNLYISNSVSLRLQHNSGGNIQFLLLFSRFPTPNVLCKSE